jgi:hypothetical protein
MTFQWELAGKPALLELHQNTLLFVQQEIFGPLTSKVTSSLRKLGLLRMIRMVVGKLKMIKQ